ncbi:MAG: hypothetical protein SGPRY_008557 [Prymnesium sp.]
MECILVGLPEREGQLPVALDIGAGSSALVKHLGLDARYAEEPLPKWLGRDSFDVVFILNVLDRCKDPEKMLRQAVNHFLRADATADTCTEMH